MIKGINNSLLITPFEATYVIYVIIMLLYKELLAASSHISYFILHINSKLFEYVNFIFYDFIFAIIY